MNKQFLMVSLHTYSSWTFQFWLFNLKIKEVFFINMLGNILLHIMKKSIKAGTSAAEEHDKLYLRCRYNT